MTLSQKAQDTEDSLEAELEPPGLMRSCGICGINSKIRLAFELCIILQQLDVPCVSKAQTTV